MSPGAKHSLSILACLLVISASAVCIYRHFATPNHDVGLHERVGEVMAEETARWVGPKGRLVLISIPTRGLPELETQLRAFRLRLKQLGDYELKDHQLDTKDQPKYGIGAGLSGRRFVRTVKNNPKADAIISFVGVPGLSAEELAELNPMPKFIAESRSPDHLSTLFDRKLMQAAVVSRFVFPAPGPAKPKTPQQWFERRYQVITADDLVSVPPSDAE